LHESIARECLCGCALIPSAIRDLEKRHRLLLQISCNFSDTEKALTELHIPRAANIARIGLSFAA